MQKAIPPTELSAANHTCINTYIKIYGKQLGIQSETAQPTPAQQEMSYSSIALLKSSWWDLQFCPSWNIERARARQLWEQTQDREIESFAR